MQVATAISILNGIAIGKIKIYDNPELTINEALCTDTEAELIRFEESRQKAIKQQQTLYEKALTEVGEENAAVFDVHAMMLDDDDLVDAIKEIIQTQGHMTISGKTPNSFKNSYRNSRPFCVQQVCSTALASLRK